MEERSDTPVCERGNDLIAFLYHELSESEGRNFERHLSQCAACERELNSFQQIRSGVAAWRNECLGIATTPPLTLTEPEKPSAFAAFRRFFELSPLWLKGAVAFASLLFCISAFFALASLNRKPTIAVVPDQGLSEEQLKARIEAGVQARLGELAAQQKPANEQVAVNLNPPVKEKKRTRDTHGYTTNTRRAPLTKAEREQLAADLRLLSDADDSDLNLLGEQINR